MPKWVGMIILVTINLTKNRTNHAFMGISYQFGRLAIRVLYG